MGCQHKNRVLSSEPDDSIVQLGDLSEVVNTASPVSKRHALPSSFLVLFFLK